jgi:hypothetical protein
VLRQSTQSSINEAEVHVKVSWAEVSSMSCRYRLKNQAALSRKGSAVAELESLSR